MDGTCALIDGAAKDMDGACALTGEVGKDMDGDLMVGVSNFTCVCDWLITIGLPRTPCSASNNLSKDIFAKSDGPGEFSVFIKIKKKNVLNIKRSIIKRNCYIKRFLTYTRLKR